MSEKTIVVFSAHADDCEFFAGGTVARFVSEGYQVIEVIATDNSRGSYDLDPQTLIARSRDVEARRAAEILGKKEVIFLGHSDGFLGDVPLNELRETFIRQLRLHRPRIMMTWDPWAPYEPHPDHRQVGMAAVEAAEFASMPLFHPDQVRQGLEPHLVMERYYFAKFPERAEKVVDITGFIDKKIQALLAHDSQMKLTVDTARRVLGSVESAREILPLLDRDNCGPVVDMFIRAWAGKVGKEAGVEYGEAFRYETPADLFSLE